MTTRTVMLPVDSSAHSEKAFNCKYGIFSVVHSHSVSRRVGKQNLLIYSNLVSQLARLSGSGQVACQPHNYKNAISVFI